MARHSTESDFWTARQNRPSGHAPLILAAGLLVCACAFYYEFFAPQNKNSGADALETTDADTSVYSVYFTEAMSDNRSAHPNNLDEYSDWIELANLSGEPIDIEGWTLTDATGVQNLFTFPRYVLEPNEILLIYASGEESANAGRAFHTAFRLSASGDVLTLADKSGAKKCVLTLPAMNPNQAYARDEAGDWHLTEMYTPGYENTEENYRALALATDESTYIAINEVMANNATYAPDEDGEYRDWIEIINTSTDRVISLADWTLTDDAFSENPWRFPDVSLQPGECLLIYASEKNRATAGSPLHADFCLDADGETVRLINAQGRLADEMIFPALACDQSLSRDTDGTLRADLLPTPGRTNDENGVTLTARELAGSNASGVFLNEVVCSTRTVNVGRYSYDWVELYNASSAAADLALWGLSDNPNHPRKWQFPEGTVIQPGAYLLVYCSGLDQTADGAYHTNFSLNATDCREVTLSTPEGAVVDRLPFTAQYAEISYGRIGNLSDRFGYFEQPTPGAANPGEAYAGRAAQVSFSMEGGVVTGNLFTLTLAAQSGATIYFTTDCTTPTRASKRYSGPITLTETTVVRAIAVKDGLLDAFENTRTYLLNVGHELPIVALTSAPDGLFGEENGIYVNYEETWVRDAFLEYYQADGELTLGQGVEISLHGNDARLQKQKVFNVIARLEYGDNRLRGKLFPNRDKTEYQSVMLSASSEDGIYSRMRDAMLSTLAEGTELMWQDAQAVVLYINGAYWGQYYLRERVNTRSIAQWNDWADHTDLDLVSVDTYVYQGSNKTFAELMTWLETHSLTEAENLAHVESVVDVENYLDYVMLEMYVANSDLSNMKRYRSDQGDGKWHWILFDLDWAFYNDTDSYMRWMTKDGVATDNRLFMALMENDEVKARFLTTLGERLTTNWSSATILEKIDRYAAWIEPEIEATYDKFYTSESSRWYEQVEVLREHARTRPGRLMAYIQAFEGFTDAEMAQYFSKALSMYAAQ